MFFCSIEHQKLVSSHPLFSRKESDTDRTREVDLVHAQEGLWEERESFPLARIRAGRNRRYYLFRQQALYARRKNRALLLFGDLVQEVSNGKGQEAD